MLSRRHLRIKVMQALYAFFQSHNDRLDIAEKQLLQSIDKIYDLYIYQLSLLIEIIEFGRIRIENAKLKFYPDDEDLNPNTKFIDNKFILQLEVNKFLLKQIEEKNISWFEEQEIVRKIYQKIKESDEYNAYLKSTDNSYKADKDIIIKLFKKYISKTEILQYFYEEKSIYWADDYDIATMMVIKTIKFFHKDMDENVPLPSLYKNSEKSHLNNDREFTIKLFRKTILRSEEYEKLISEKAKNWEIKRIAIMDIILIKMALTEILEFTSIPLKVSMNEYIEISKLYSTHKSKIFINGVLDKLIVDLKAKNQIKKLGRGLIED